VTQGLIENAMAHGEETQAEERQIGVGKEVAPGVRKPAQKERPAGRQQREIIGMLRRALGSLAERIGERRGRGPVGPPGVECGQLGGHRAGRCSDHCGSQQRGSGPASDEKQDHPPGGVGEEDTEPKAHFGDHPEYRQRGQPAEIDGDDRRLARFQPPQEHGEANPEKEGKDPPGLLLDQDPHTPADQILQPGDLDTHLLVEVHQDHPEQGKPAQDVEGVQAMVAVHRGERRRGQCGRGRERNRLVGHHSPG